MSKNTCRMTGMVLMLISVFFLIGGLYFDHTQLPHTVTILCLITGIIMLVIGIIFYRILKSDQ